jgi:hypothetical protein
VSVAHRHFEQRGIEDVLGQDVVDLADRLFHGGPGRDLTVTAADLQAVGGVAQVERQLAPAFDELTSLALGPGRLNLGQVQDLDGGAREGIDVPVLEAHLGQLDALGQLLLEEIRGQHILPR